MKAMKDKRKFGYSYDKEVRRIWRIEARQLALC